MSRPLTPPLAPTKPCGNCSTGRVIGRKRLCEDCKSANKKASHQEYVVNRRELNELRHRVEILEAIIAQGMRIRAITSRSAA